jgi:sugar lactone lactonase YvrE
MKINSCFVFLFLFALNVMGAEPQVWSVSSRADVLKGDARAVSIGENGTIRPAPALTEVFKTEQPYIWSSVSDAAGNVYLGTGGEGKIFKVDAAGRGSQFADLAELNVSALAIGRGGEIFAASSPDGKVYKIDAGGRAEVYFAPGQKYIWSLAVLSDGSLAVGTGDGGRIYKVRSAGATPEGSILFDTSETHIITLAADAQGNLFAGTDSSGIVMRFGPDGKPFALLDSPLREIHQLSLGADGSVYALALGESVNAPKTEAAATPAAPAANPTVSVERPNPAVPETPAKSKYDLTSAKSAVYRILADGSADLIWASPTVTAFSIHAQPGGVLVGTSDKGRVYRVSDAGAESLLLQTDASQISTLRADARSIIATSSNQGILYRIANTPAAEGTYESAILDTKGTSSWGRLWWRSTGTVTVQTRSGNTDKPDETWSAWSSPITNPAGAAVTSPKARYFQWRTVLRGGSAEVDEVNVAFAPRNIAPEVLSIQVLPTNVGLAANPAVQIDPNIEASGLSPADFGIPVVTVPPRKLYQRGATSLQWTAEDRNGDKLVYDVLYRGAVETAFRPLRTDLTDNFIAIDGQALADGRYVFKIVARDTLANSPATALSGERVTEPIDIDNTPPTVTPGTINARGAAFSATDRASYIVRAEYSINGGEWQTIFPDDGIPDSPTENFTVEVPQAPGEYVVTLRVFDVNRNSGNARATVKR